MTADELVQLRQIGQQLLEHLETKLPKRCEAEGHIWDHPEGTKEINHHDEWASDAAGDSIKYQVATEYFKRTCKRCGTTEARHPNLTSPFQP